MLKAWFVANGPPSGWGLVGVSEVTGHALEEDTGTLALSSLPPTSLLPGCLKVSSLASTHAPIRMYLLSCHRPRVTGPSNQGLKPLKM